MTTPTGSRPSSPRPAARAPSRRGRLALRSGAAGLVALAGGAGLNFAWEWLAAGGIFVLLVAATPCAALYLLGLALKSDRKRDAHDL
jgi:lipopolysaccharide export LptBFGC system permease protein LptF